MNESYTYDGEEVLRLFENGLNKLNPIRYDSKYKALLGEIIINKLNRWDEVIRRQKDEPLTIVVCGEFKRGKSSLINALLGEDVVTTDITTETITINKICYGLHSNELVLSGGKRIKLTDEQLKSDKLREILKDAKGSNQLILKRPNEFLKDAVIIDTPGLGDSLADFSEDVQEALRMADAVIYVFSVAYPLSTQEQFFIKTCILPQKYTDVLLVGNYADVIEHPQDFQRAKETVVRRIEDILPDTQPTFVSALDERSRQIDAARPNPEMQQVLENAFAGLREKLSQLLQDKRDYVVPDRVQRLISAMTADVKKETDAIEEGLKLDSQQAKERIESHKEKKEKRQEEQKKVFDLIERTCESHRAEAVIWIEELLKEMEADADGLLNKVSADDIKRFYTLFCVETLQGAFEKCSEHFLSSVYDELTKISPELTKDFSFETAAISPKLVFEVNNATFTSGDKLAFAGSIASNIHGNGFISMITDYVAGTMREKEINKKTPDYIDSIKKQLSGLHISVVPSLAKAYKEIAERAKEQLLAYFNNEIQDLDNAVAQAVTVSGRDDAAKEEIRSAVAQLIGILEDLNKTLAFS